MKTKKWRVVRGILMAFAVLFVGLIGGWVRVAGYPVIDPAPSGEGSDEELDTISRQFRAFYQTGSLAALPAGYVRLTGYESEEADAKETWMIYYATASHSFRSGGTIVLLGSDGRIDGYFGHKCSKRDGGTVAVAAKAPFYWSGGTYFHGLEGVRQSFGRTYAHQRTEQVSGGKGG